MGKVRSEFVQRFALIGVLQNILAPTFYRRSRLVELAARIGYVVGDKMRAKR